MPVLRVRLLASLSPFVCACRSIVSEISNKALAADDKLVATARNTLAPEHFGTHNNV
jgi:hypothetical protein